MKLTFIRDKLGENRGVITTYSFQHVLTVPLNVQPIPPYFLLHFFHSTFMHNNIPPLLYSLKSPLSSSLGLVPYLMPIPL